MVMVLSLVPSAFAADGDGISIAFDKVNPNPGDTITATLTVNKTFSDASILETYLDFGEDVTYEKIEFLNVELNSRIIDSSRLHIYGWGDEDEEIAQKVKSIPTGAFARITFKISEYAAGKTLNFRLWGEFDDIDWDTLNNWDDNYSVEVTGSTVEKPTATGYSVSMGADQQVAAGQQVRIPVTVTSSEPGITGFNAYDMTFTYDPAALTLNTTSNAAANLTVDDNNGTVRVRRYGETTALGTALTLDFTANKATSSTVTLTAAKFDLDANSINFDAPAAAITDADTAVKTLWKVKLPDGFLSTAANGSTLVENGGDFTFKTTDTHYEYYLNITTNGATNMVKMDKATYTIKNVTDNVTVTVSDRVAKTYTLKFVVDDRFAEYFGTEPLTLADLGIENETVTVTYPNDYQFIVKFPGTGRFAGVSVEPSSNSFKSYTDRLENGDYNYVLEGSKLVGDENDVITITIGVYIKTDRDKFNILVTGDTADFDADNPRTFYSGENYTFKLNKSEYYDYEISASYKTKNLSGSTVTEYKPVKDNEDGTYTVINCPMADLTIHITKTAKAVDPSTVTVNQYVELNEKTVFLVRVAGQLSGGKVFTYDGSPMYKTTSYGYSTYSWLVIVEKGQTLTKEDVLQLIKLEDGAAAGSVGIDTDVNQSGKADVNDAQLVYDIYNRVYNDGYETVSMEKFLRADQNADGVLDSQDAVTLAGKLHV